MNRKDEQQNWLKFWLNNSTRCKPLFLTYTLCKHLCTSNFLISFIFLILWDLKRRNSSLLNDIAAGKRKSRIVSTRRIYFPQKVLDKVFQLRLILKIVLLLFGLSRSGNAFIYLIPRFIYITFLTSTNYFWEHVHIILFATTPP